ncbi:MAG TPA: DUF6510 family protein [Thermoleophilaceae bacterium]
MHKDGNAIAGVLEEIFTVEVTAETRTCQSCGQENAIGAHRLFTGAGYVLRCPNCSDVAATIATVPGDYRVTLFGAWSVQPPQ